MPDPLSISTGAAGLIGFAIQTTQIVINLCNSYKDQDNDRDRALQNLQTLSRQLLSLQNAVDNRPTSTTSGGDLRQGFEHDMRRCNEAIKELQNQWEKVAKSGFRNQLSRLRYPFRKKKLAEMYGNTAHICQIVSDTLQGLERQDASISELRGWISNLRGWLDAPNAQENQYLSRKKHHASTGDWFINGDDFCKWLKTPNSFLWIHGVPGSGKSILFSTAIHYISQVNVAHNAGHAFFYFDFKDVSKQSAEGMLRALILQLSRQESERDCKSDLDQLYPSNESRDLPLDELITCLQRMVQRFPNAFILLDALDESPWPEEREIVLATVATMRQWALPSLHILVTSRDVVDIREALTPQRGQEVTMTNANVERDIANYVSFQLATNPNLRQWKNDGAEIQAALAERAPGVFLYVACQVRPLKEAVLKLDRDRVLRALPRDMHETYERLLRDVGETNIENVRRIMTLLCYSNRLLTVEEVCHALTVDLQKPPCLDLDSKVLTENGLRKICGNLIEISQREIYPGLVAPVVNVAHSLVQEYLESNAIRRQEMAAFALERGSANRELAQICLVYLKLALSDETRGNRRLEKFPLALFSALEWFNYYAACPDKDSGLQNLAFDLFHDGKGGCFTSWIELHDVDSTWGIRSYADAGQVLNHKGAPLYYASLLGLEEVADKIIATGSDVNAQGGRHGNALWAASLKGHTAVVKILLSHQADVNFQNGELGTALQVASLKGHTGVVHALLSYQAEVNIQSGEYGTALQAASCKGHKEIVQALLNYKADVNAQGGRYGSALKMATDHDHKEVVQMLLECGAHPSHRDLSEELRAASVQGDENKVDELLNVGHGYSNDQLQDAKDTALVLVSCHCHEIAVRLLLKKGANVNARPAKFGNTALFGASWTQRDAVLWTTYQFWLKIDVEDPAIRRLATRIAPETSMMNALIHREGSSQQVFEILSTLVMDDLSTKGCLPGKEHLNISFEDSEKVVEILLENGADVNAQGGYYGNALQAASHIGNEKVVKMLLQYGANVNVQGGYYGNALQAASYLGNEKVVKMLLQYGADVNAQGGYYGSARNAASVKGHQGVEQILRDHQARIDGVNGAAPAEITP